MTPLDAIEYVILGVLVAVLGRVAYDALYYLRWVSSQPLTGDWTQTIESSGKRDVIHCRQDKNALSGKIEREVPDTERQMRWAFRGVLAGNALYCAYWPTNVTGKRGSYGSISLRNTGTDTWSGIYVKVLTEEHGPLEHVDRLVDTPLTWALRRKR